MTSPFIPCPFTYGDAPQGGAVIPMIVAGRDPSDVTDTQYISGYLWLSDLFQGGTGNTFIQAGNVNGEPTWTLLSAGAAGALNTLSDGSITVLPVLGNIQLLGKNNQITSTGSAASHNITFTLATTLIAPGSIQSTTTITAETGFTVTTGNALISSGNLTLTSGNLTLSSGNLSVTGSTNSIQGITDINTSTASVTAIGTGGTGAVTIGNATGGTTITGLTTLAGLTVLGNVSINTSGAGTFTLGGTASSGANIIHTGTSASGLQIEGDGNSTGILIGNDTASGANVIVIGNQISTTNMQLLVGTGSTVDLLIDGATGSKFQIGNSITTGSILIGGSAQSGTITLGSSTSATANSVLIANGLATNTTTVNIANNTTYAVAINIAGATSIGTASVIGIQNGLTPAAAQTLNIMTGVTSAAVAQTVNIMTGAVATGTSVFNLGTGSQPIAINLGGIGAGVKTIVIGNGVSGNQISIGNGANTSSQTVSISSGAAASTSIVNVLSGAFANDAVTQTLNLVNGVALGSSSQVINMFSSTASSTAQTLNIFNGVNTVGTNTVNISATTGAPVGFNLLTGVPATGTHTLTVGSATGLGAVTLTSATSVTIAIGASNNIILGTTGGNYKGKAANTAPAAGFLGEQIRATVVQGSAVALTTATPANVAFISLTAGIWDVSGVISMTGIATGTIFTGSVNSTSATLGTLGDNSVQTSSISTATADSSVTIPSWRISLSSTTTVYLVAQSTFTIGTPGAYGRISATRVA